MIRIAREAFYQEADMRSHSFRRENELIHRIDTFFKEEPSSFTLLNLKAEFTKMHHSWILGETYEFPSGVQAVIVDMEVSFRDRIDYHIKFACKSPSRLVLDMIITPHGEFIRMSELVSNVLTEVSERIVEAQKIPTEEMCIPQSFRGFHIGDKVQSVLPGGTMVGTVISFVPQEERIVVRSNRNTDLSGRPVFAYKTSEIEKIGTPRKGHCEYASVVFDGNGKEYTFRVPEHLRGELRKDKRVLLVSRSNVSLATIVNPDAKVIAKNGGAYSQSGHYISASILAAAGTGLRDWNEVYIKGLTACLNIQLQEKQFMSAAHVLDMMEEYVSFGYDSTSWALATCKEVMRLV